jgi:hypothetical protein
MFTCINTQQPTRYQSVLLFITERHKEPVQAVVFMETLAVLCGSDRA